MVYLETKQPEKSEKKSTFFGVKAAVTRIIANLAYQNTAAQDMVLLLFSFFLFFSFFFSCSSFSFSSFHLLLPPPIHPQVRELGALQLVMSQCGVDDNNPYGREWGILALRNLTEGNEKNQNYIREMNPIKVFFFWWGCGRGGW